MKLHSVITPILFNRSLALHKTRNPISQHFVCLDETGTSDWARRGANDTGTDDEFGESEVPLLLGTARDRKAEAAGAGSHKANEEGHQDAGGHYAKRNVHFGNRKIETHDVAV